MIPVFLFAWGNKSLYFVVQAEFIPMDCRIKHESVHSKFRQIEYLKKKRLWWWSQLKLAEWMEIGELFDENDVCTAGLPWELVLMEE
jgi:hypothetical protein